MKIETLLLCGLFAASVLVCGCILGAMLHAHGDGRARHPGMALLDAPSACTLPVDGVMCPRLPG
jgi:crotonobetainyl-CoA:carnitine CoA-transferase CaiB-like acyl-CoA transferase